MAEETIPPLEEFDRLVHEQPLIAAWFLLAAPGKVVYPPGLSLHEEKSSPEAWEKEPLEPNVVEHKYYSKEAGNVILEKKVAGGSGHMELIEMKPE